MLPLAVPRDPVRASRGHSGRQRRHEPVVSAIAASSALKKTSACPSR